MSNRTMKSRAATKRSKVNMNSRQNQGMETEGEAPENAMNVSRKLETNPFKMGNVLEKVLSFLDADSIKSARQLNKFWSAEGAKVLIKKCYIKIPSVLLLQKSASSKNRKHLDKFKAFLSHKSTEVSMIPKITVQAAGDIKLWKSLGVLGKQVKALKLQDIKAKLLHELLDLLPNLEHLKMGINVNFNTTAIMNVLSSVMSTSKGEKNPNRSPLVISWMRLFPHNEKELQDLEKFSECTNIMIEKLQFCLDDPIGTILHVPHVEARIAKALSKLLLTSKNTLKKMRLLELEFYLSLLEFPRMTALTKIELGFGTDEEHNLLNCFEFPSSFQFSENTPHLEHVEIEYWGSEEPPGLGDNLLTSLFENTGKALSVKCLEYRNRYSVLNTDQLFKTFPNIEEFKTNGTESTESMFQSLWTFGKNIKKLEISIELDNFDGDDSRLDCYFTGFSPETVEDIKECPKLRRYLVICDHGEKLRVNPSILNLKELQVLTLCCYGRSERYYRPQRMLAIAGEFAFKLMPSVWVVIDLEYCSRPEDSREIFSEVSEIPSVTIV